MNERCLNSSPVPSRSKIWSHGWWRVGSNWRERSPADERPPFHHRSYDKAQNYIRYALSRPRTLILLTGEPATGKTRLAEELMHASTQAERTVRRLDCERLSASVIEEQVAGLVKFQVESLGEEDQRRGQPGRPRQTPLSGESPLLVVDNAQLLSPSALGAVCRLGCSGDSAALPWQVFLVGTPRLWDVVIAPEMRQIHKQVVAACQLEPMLLEEIRPYLQHCFDVGGPNGEPHLSDEAVSLIHEVSLGAPGRINRLCERLFTACCPQSEQELSATAVREAVDGLRRAEPRSRGRAVEPAGIESETADAVQGQRAIPSQSAATGTLQQALVDLQARIPDIEAAVILADSGSVVAGVLPETLHRRRVAGLSATLIESGQRALAEWKCGTLKEVKEVIVRGEHGYALIFKTGQDLVLLAITKPDAMLGLLIPDLRALAKTTKRLLCA